MIDFNKPLKHMFSQARVEYIGKLAYTETKYVHVVKMVHAYGNHIFFAVNEQGKAPNCEDILFANIKQYRIAAKSFKVFNSENDAKDHLSRSCRFNDYSYSVEEVK